MDKTMSCGMAALAVLAVAFAHGTEAAAMSRPAGLSQASTAGDVVLVAQKRQGKGKRSQVKISEEHRQKIKEIVPQEYHQYLPSSVTGGGQGGAAGGAR